MGGYSTYQTLFKYVTEVVALLAGILGPDPLAAQSIVLNTSSLAYMLPLGISVASSTRIGNCLGAGAPRVAKIASRAALVLALCFASLNSSILILVRSHWGKLWSSDPTVIQIVSDILPLAALFQLSDGLGAVGGGVLRGCGHQKLGAYINLCGYYILALPLGSLLGFKFHWGLQGLWTGLTVGIVMCSFVLLVLILRMDWKREEERAKALVAVDSHLLLDEEESVRGDEESAKLLAHADIPVLEEDLGGVPLTRD